MKEVRLTDSDKRRLQREGSGDVGEQLVANHIRGYSRNLSEAYDVATKTGRIGEVKTTLSERTNGKSGRFRIFKSQHDRLRKRNRTGTAWYFFVVIDTTSRDLSAKIKRLKPPSVGHKIAGLGGWYDAGHRSGEERKLPISVIF
jgi:hypothetical protein